MAVDEDMTVQSFLLSSVIPRVMCSSAKGQPPHSTVRELNIGEALLK